MLPRFTLFLPRGFRVSSTLLLMREWSTSSTIRSNEPRGVDVHHADYKKRYKSLDCVTMGAFFTFHGHICVHIHLNSQNINSFAD